MVLLPSKFIIDSTLSVGTIFRLEAPELIDTPVPHYFIVVGKDEDENFMVICTSQGEKKEQYFKRNNLDFSGLVYINPDSTNNFTVDTYVNCNDYFPMSNMTLTSKLDDGKMQLTGNVSLNHYLQIKNGIIESDTNDLPEYVLNHPDE